MSTLRTVHPSRGLTGTVHLPADKSIAHRAAMLAALAGGTSVIRDFSDAADPQSTLACIRSLGVPVETEGSTLRITGGHLQAPDDVLDCGNSGTTMRLLAGILAGQPFASILTGDASLSRRPMERIARPLRAMGARIRLTEGHAPVYIEGTHLQSITYTLPVASAQVKSCVLLAGLFARGSTTVVESVPSRDHTERMLGLPVEIVDGKRHIHVPEGFAVPVQHLRIPRDFSAAAFFLVAGTLVPDSHLLIPGVGLNPTRSALLDVLREMGASIEVHHLRMEGKEPVADLEVRSGALHGIEIGGAVIPNLIDEIPVLAVAAAFAEGRTVIRDAAELRVKETDRIHTMAHNLTLLGARVEEREDGLIIEGGHPIQGGRVHSFDDHRIAMAMAVAALRAQAPVQIEGADAPRISFPDFWQQLAAVGGTVA